VLIFRFPDTKSRESWKMLIEQAMQRAKEDEAAAAAAAAAVMTTDGAMSRTANEDSTGRRFSLWKSTSMPKV
jgi:hypothetical protein